MDPVPVTQANPKISVTFGGIYSEAAYAPKNIAQDYAWDAASYTHNITNTVLRILPLGDSITYGSLSSDGNGYRNRLFTTLVGQGNAVDFVGSVKVGTMSDNDNEGHIGATIDQIASFAGTPLSAPPNVVLIHAGTVDMSQGLDLANAAVRLGKLIDTVLANFPGVLVLVAQIIGSRNDGTQSNIATFNAAIPGVVAARTSAGAHVMIVDMFGFALGSTDYADDLTPNDNGYAGMANMWFRAISYADSEMGWISGSSSSGGGTEGGSGTGGGTGGSGTGSQLVALASYIPPVGTVEGPTWTRIIDYSSDKLGLLVANVVNGPGNVVNTDWQAIITRAVASGKRVIGYVRTGYLGQVNDPFFETRLGSMDLANWISQIQTDVELWYSLYGNSIGGIFFDEGWNQCGENNQYAEVYRLITETVKRQHPGAFTVLNPGDHMPQCFEHSADTLLTFESNYTNYMNPSFYKPNGWTANDTRKNWHIIYDVHAEDVAAVAALALQRGAGLVHITNTVMDNPYNHLPDDAYMQSLFHAVSGGKLLLADPLPWSKDGSAQQPSGLAVATSDYSSVSLTWSKPASPPLAIAVLMSGTEVARLPGTISAVTIGNLPLDLGTFYFSLKAIGGSGTESAATGAITANTLTLKDNKPVVNVQGSWTASDTTYSADVFVPSAFVRLYLVDPDLGCQLPAWPTTYNPGHFVCAHYMVEGNTLYKYTGGMPSGNPLVYAWGWTATGDKNNVNVTRTGYKYTWHLNIGSSTIDMNNVIVQAEGYGPMTNVLSPCPDRWNLDSPNDGFSCIGTVPYDCLGEDLCNTMDKHHKYCDLAANAITSPRSAQNMVSNTDSAGHCYAEAAGLGCKVFVHGTQADGSNCAYDGQTVWNLYQNIYNASIGGCTTCGSYHFGNGCMVSSDYDYGCKQRTDVDDY